MARARLLKQGAHFCVSSPAGRLNSCKGKDRLTNTIKSCVR